MGFISIFLPCVLPAVFGTARFALLWQRESIERITGSIETQQLRWAFDATFPALLRIWDIDSARKPHNSINVLRSGFGTQPNHERCAACLYAFDYRLPHRFFFWQHNWIGQFPSTLDPVA